MKSNKPHLIIEPMANSQSITISLFTLEIEIIQKAATRKYNFQITWDEHLFKRVIMTVADANDLLTDIDNFIPKLSLVKKDITENLRDKILMELATLNKRQ
jgi:hypothetical protein